jgi:hypothetical protein
MSATPATKDEHMMTIGVLVHRASANEILMLNSFRLIAGVTPKTAKAIFYTFDSFPPRKTLLIRTCEANGDEDDMKLVLKIIASVEKSNNQRKQVAHAINFHDDPELVSAAKTLNPKSSQKPQLVTKQFLSTLLNHSTEALQEGHHATEELFQKHGLLLELII